MAGIRLGGLPRPEPDRLLGKWLPGPQRASPTQNPGPGPGPGPSLALWEMAGPHPPVPVPRDEEVPAALPPSPTSPWQQATRANSTPQSCEDLSKATSGAAGQWKGRKQDRTVSGALGWRGGGQVQGEAADQAWVSCRPRNEGVDTPI